MVLGRSNRSILACPLLALRGDLFKAEGFGKFLLRFHALSVTIPVACAGWRDLLEHHGRLDLRIALAPAVNLAEEGIPVTPLTAYFWQRGVERQLKNAPGGEALTIGGREPKPGEIFRTPGLARTFRALGGGGAQAISPWLRANSAVDPRSPSGRHGMIATIHGEKSKKEKEEEKEARGPELGRQAPPPAHSAHRLYGICAVDCRFIPR